MEIIDQDLQSVQAVRCLIRRARDAQRELAAFSQTQIDAIVQAIAEAGEKNAERLGRMAQEETGFGRPEDKTVKNRFASRTVYEAIRDMKTVGILREDTEKKILEIGVPVGVVAALIPSTNPTSTVIYKAQIALKAGNAIVFSPHPGAKASITEAARVVREAAESAGCPAGTIGCMELLTMESTAELMKKADLILATGSSAMVKAAYSSGTPAIGVGPGNGPSFIERSADIPLAIKRILDSKTFDNGTICASEQSIVTEECICDAVLDELTRQGAYVLSPEEKKKVAAILMRANGTMNPRIVGKTPQYIATLAGIRVPEDARVLVGCETEVGRDVPFSREKLCPVLAFYVEADWKSACDTCIRILENEGAGHTMGIHSQNGQIIREFALKKPVSRFLVNTPGSLGGIGATTNLFPALTLGCGAVGGSSSADNISPMHLLNVRRMAYGAREREDVTGGSAAVSLVSASNAAAPAGEEELMQAVLARVLQRMNLN